MHSQSARSTWKMSMPRLTLRLRWYKGHWKTSACNSGKLDFINPFLKGLIQNEFFSWQKCMFPVKSHFEAVFNLDFNSWQDQKRARQIHTLERVATLFLGLRHDAQNASSCFKSSPEIMRPQKPKRMTQTSMCWTGEDHLWESKIYIHFQPQKPASNKSNNLICRPDSARKRKMVFWDFWNFQFQSRWQGVWDFWGFQFTMQFTRWRAVLRFLRFSVSIALTRRLRFFCPTGDSGYYNTIRRGPQAGGHQGPAIIPPKAVRIFRTVSKSLPRYKVPFLLHALGV